MFGRSVFNRNGNGCYGPAGLAFLVLFNLSAGGCGGGAQSASEALKTSLEVNKQPALTVVKVSGTVTIDGSPPVIDRHSSLYVMAYDPKNPPKGRFPTSATCDKSGHFEFNTYGGGDGLPPGSYVALFSQPKFGGEELLKNLYNDPDKNAKEERFQLYVTAPGKTDWNFDLAVEGKEPLSTPGPNAARAVRVTKK